MHRPFFPHFIIVSGSGKKVGKTFMAASLIRSFSSSTPLVALKISPHVHDSFGNTLLRAESGGFRIYQDLGTHQKNSGKFLDAGALQSFFMETADQHLGEAFSIFMAECNPENHPVICESGALGLRIKPGISIFISRSSDEHPEHKSAAMRQADLVLRSTSFSTPEIIERISFSQNGWHLA